MSGVHVAEMHVLSIKSTHPHLRSFGCSLGELWLLSDIAFFAVALLAGVSCQPLVSALETELWLCPGLIPLVSVSALKRHFASYW